MRNGFFVAAAIQCLKKKKLYETQIEQLSNFQLRVHDQVMKDIEVFQIFNICPCIKLIGGHFVQIIMLENAKATTDTVDALRSGSSAVKAIQQSL